MHCCLPRPTNDDNGAAITVTTTTAATTTDAAATIEVVAVAVTAGRSGGSTVATKTMAQVAINHAQIANRNWGIMYPPSIL